MWHFEEFTLGNWELVLFCFLFLNFYSHPPFDFAISKETLTQDGESINNKLCCYI